MDKSLFFFRWRRLDITVHMVGSKYCGSSLNVLLTFDRNCKKDHAVLCVPNMIWEECKGFNEAEQHWLIQWAYRMLLVIAKTWKEETGEEL